MSDAADAAPRALWGVDFTCAPSRRKPITVARGRLRDGVLMLEAIDELHRADQFEALLHEPGPWLGAFDFPFGLPRSFVDAMALGGDCAAVIGEIHRRWPQRMQWRAAIDVWGNTQPAGRRLRHRRADTAMPGISSSSPLQTRYVPVGFMYYEGLSRLVRAGVTLPRMHDGGAGDARVALEGYPGLLAFELIGRRSYKNADTAERRAAREDIVSALEGGRTRLRLRWQLGAAERAAMLADAGGDRLDAALCLMQAAWASQRPGYGLPAAFDTVEGWIATT